jgi:hypothetical protein
MDTTSLAMDRDVQTDRQTDRRTVTLNNDISAVWESKPRTTPQKDSSLLMGPEQVTGPKTLQII